jgi:transcriptional regulator with XRE-family HTH domain
MAWFQQVQNYEKGANSVSAVRLFDICKILNVSPVTMFRLGHRRIVEAQKSALAGRPDMPLKLVTSVFDPKRTSVRQPSMSVVGVKQT